MAGPILVPVMYRPDRQAALLLGKVKADPAHARRRHHRFGHAQQKAQRE